MVKIIPETEAHFEAIKQIHDSAFAHESEGRLVHALRRNHEFLPELSLVALKGDVIVGHILFFPILVEHNQDHFQTLALAPMGVHSDYQKQGIGKELIEAGLEQAKKAGYKSVIVLGHPEYYKKFGFTPASQWNIQAPFEVPDEAFLAIELEDGALKQVQGIVVYPEEFLLV